MEFLEGELHSEFWEWILGVRTRRKHSEAINHQSCPTKNTSCCEGHHCVSEWKWWFLLWADLRGWGSREGLLPAPSFPLLFSPLHDFPLFHPLGRGKWNFAPFFWSFQLILTKDPLLWSFLTGQMQIAWSCFHPRLSQLWRAQLQTIIPQFCVKMKQTPCSSHCPKDNWLPVWEISAYFSPSTACLVLLVQRCAAQDPSSCCA